MALTTHKPEIDGELSSPWERPGAELRAIDWVNLEGIQGEVLCLADRLRSPRLHPNLRASIHQGFDETLQAFENAFAHGDQVTITFPAQAASHSQAYDRLLGDDPDAINKAKQAAGESGVHTVSFDHSKITGINVLPFPKGKTASADYHPVVDIRVQTISDPATTRFAQSDIGVSALIEEVSLGRWYRFSLEEATFRVTSVRPPQT